MAKSDTVARKACHARGRCEAGGLDKVLCAGGLQWCHIVGRKNYRLRWSQMNCLCMCQGHHLYYTYNPWEWQEFIRTNFPANYEFIEAHRLEKWDKTYPTEVME